MSPLSRVRVATFAPPALRRAALLLEVVISLTVMVGAMGFLCAELASGLRMTTMAEEQLRASELADRALALVQYDTDLQQRMLDQQETDGDFGAQYPGFFWRITVGPVDSQTQGLGLIVVEVLHQRDPAQQQSSDGAVVVQHLAMLKATPAQIDLVADAGLSEEQADELRQMVPIPDFDPRAVDLQQIVSMSPDDLLTLAQSVMSLKGGSGDVTGFLSMLQNLGLQTSDLAQGGNIDAEQLLQNLSPQMVDQLRNAITQQGLAGGGGLGQPGGMGGRGPRQGGGLGQGGGVGPGGGLGAGLGQGGRGPGQGGRGPGQGGGLGQGGGGPGQGGRGPGQGGGPGQGAGGPGQGGRGPGQGGGQPGGPGGPGQGGSSPGGQGGARGGAGGAAGGNSNLIGRGSGPGGSYTIEDLIRMRDAYEASKGGQ